MVKKFISEVVGTMLLVLFGCGTAVAANTYATNVFGSSAMALVFNMLLLLSFILNKLYIYLICYLKFSIFMK